MPLVCSFECQGRVVPQGSEHPGFKKFDPEKQPLTAELKAKGLTDEQSRSAAEGAGVPLWCSLECQGRVSVL